MYSQFFCAVLTLTISCLSNAYITNNGRMRTFGTYNVPKLGQCVIGGPYASGPMYSCHGATFVETTGFFQPCTQHSQCYHAREPTEWCRLLPHQSWTNEGCHCDQKVGSCVIERFDNMIGQLQWTFCTPKAEFYC
ncbi:unnamed protein product [Cylicocyclus nassatus]|uniref:Secreted protein n=1 Tax=Cylicocyclus nassatus TaxID=53992 RepID=A0AA36M7V1_CYLNA|nr:unnamed protein product [Cylicocyclus nassatus]